MPGERKPVLRPLETSLGKKRLPFFFILFIFSVSSVLSLPYPVIIP